jgi:hypothetical protein
MRITNLNMFLKNGLMEAAMLLPAKIEAALSTEAEMFPDCLTIWRRIFFFNF